MIEHLRLWLEQHELMLSVIHDPVDRSRFFVGMGYTLLLAVGGNLLALSVGVAGAVLKSSRWSGVRAAVTVYVEIMRNTPLLVQVFLLYFGIGSLLPVDTHGNHFIGATEWAIIAIGLHYGAYQIEALRAGISAVPDATLEAAEALGLHNYQLQRHVLLPLALRQALPELSNTIVQVLKATAVAYAIAVPELLYASNRIWSDNFNIPQMMQVLLLAYLLLIGATTWLLRRIEHRFRLPSQVTR
ncbi:amino acid ABC transporter permease [Pseudomonas caspiana]|nr:amino acid ABC transporter permease [Pseudomonas caspiana]TPG88781.1 amino acid ABC transporter permease [Pseudomonas caspiana]